MKRRLLFLLIWLACTACNGIEIPFALPSPLGTSTPVVIPTEVVAPASSPTPETISIPPPVTGGTLRMWVPPQFAPSAGDEAAVIFQTRLRDFTRLYPEWKVEVRVKAVDGPAGLLESLSAANSAALGALPDLIALPRPLMEMAASKGLVRPFDALTTIMTASDWYDYSRDLARIQNNIFGLPFAGDALVLIYREGAVSTPPTSWQQLTATGLPLAFPVAESRAFFPLTLYQGAGGAVQDAEGHPTIDVAALTQILTFTLAAERAGVMPNWLGLYENYDQTWQVYQERRAPLTVNWASRYLLEHGEGDAATLLPSMDGTPYAQATGWMWSLVSTDPERQKIAATLAEFLVEGGYLAKWSAVAGQLPTRSTAMSGRSESERALVTQVVSAAKVYPSADVMAIVNPLIGQAFLQVFKLQIEPDAAAQQAADALKVPK